MEWAKFQERERKKEEEEREKERVAYAQIDWHDFVVVETVDFQPNEQGTRHALAVSLVALLKIAMNVSCHCNPDETAI